MTKLMIHLKQGREKNLLQNAFQAYSNYEVGKIPSSSFQSAKCAIFCKVIQHFQPKVGVLAYALVAYQDVGLFVDLKSMSNACYGK